MSAHPATEILSAYLDQELDPGQLAAVSDHVEDCPRCQHRLDGLRRVVGELRGLSPAAVPASLVRRIELDADRAWSDRARRSTRRLPRAWSLPDASVGLGFALVFALAMILYLFTQAVGRHEGGGTRLVVPETSAAEQEAREAARLGDRVFRLRDGVWWEDGVADSAGTRFVEAQTALGRSLQEQIPGLAELLAGGRAVVMEVDGETVELIPPSPGRAQGGP